MFYALEPNKKIVEVRVSIDLIIHRVLCFPAGRSRIESVVSIPLWTRAMLQSYLMFLSR